MDANITRRQFFRLGVEDCVELMHQSDSGETGETGTEFIRPPGALKDEAVFIDTCDHCRKCSEACPYQVILHCGPASGSNEGTPYLVPGDSPCRWCPTMDCIHACPTGALTFESDGAVSAIGIAVLELDSCLTQQGILCDDCATACPSGVDAISFANRIPSIDPEACVGCGQCAYYCPATPVAIRIEGSVPK